MVGPCHGQVVMCVMSHLLFGPHTLALKTCMLSFQHICRLMSIGVVFIEWHIVYYVYNCLIYSSISDPIQHTCLCATSSQGVVDQVVRDVDHPADPSRCPLYMTQHCSRPLMMYICPFINYMIALCGHLYVHAM